MLSLYKTLIKARLMLNIVLVLGIHMEGKT